MDDTKSRIFELLELQKRSQQELADYLGVKKQTITNWKSGSNSYNKYLDKIADFFNVSIETLINKQSAPVEINENALFTALKKTYSIEELRKISSLPRDKAAEVVEYVKSLMLK